MSTEVLRYKPKISLKQAVDKITVYGLYGDHRYTPRPQTKWEVAQFYLRRNINPNKLAEECRDCTRMVSHFENLVGSTWEVSPGAEVAVFDKATRQIVSRVKGPGKIVLSTVLGHFEAACKARDSAVQSASHHDFYTAIVQGIGSIEAFLKEEARKWNENNPDDQLLDSMHNKVSFDDMIDKWIPKMTGGHKLIKGDQRWAHFRELRRIRDNHAIHPKKPAYTVSYKELAKEINLFRWGIGGLLGQLFLLFGYGVPSKVINAVYMPDVVMIEQPDEH